MAGRAIDFEFKQVGALIPNLPNDAGPLIFHPSIGAAQGVLEAPEVRFPIANLKIKIVLAISLCQDWVRAVSRCSWGLLRKSAEGLPDDNQATHEKISPHILWALIPRFTSGSSRWLCSALIFKWLRKAAISSSPI